MSQTRLVRKFGRGPEGLLKFLLALALAAGCEQEPADPARNWLFQGQWIDVDGKGRVADETCAGTFDYLDRYAGAIAFEFGVDEHLGIYRWYSQDRFDAEAPCGEDGPSACAGLNGVFSPILPTEHEVVHLANLAASPCPSLLAEGLAEYYGTTGSTASSADFELLAARLDDPSVDIPAAEYAIAGRFVGFLVERFGIAAVLDVCAITGVNPDAVSLASAMKLVTDGAPDELLVELMGEPAWCNAYSRSQSHLFVCGAASPADDAGLVGDEFQATYTLSCENKTTVGPRGGVVWIIEAIEFEATGSYLVSLRDELGEIPEVELVLTQCGPCGRVQSFAAGDALGPVQVEAGRYGLELRAAEDFDTTILLAISRVN